MTIEHDPVEVLPPEDTPDQRRRLALKALAATGFAAVAPWASARTWQLISSGAVAAPTPIVPIPSALAGGVLNSLIVDGYGQAKSIGDAGYGQLGNNTTTPDQTAPVAMTGMTSASRVAVGGISSTVTYWNCFLILCSSTTETVTSAHSLVLKTDGTVWGAGTNSKGQLGLGNTTNKSTPTKMLGITAATAISAGGQHTLVLQGGRVYGCGEMGAGQLGTGTTYVTIPKWCDLLGLVCGSSWSLLTPFDNSYNLSYQSSPVQMTGVTDAAAIAAGKFHSLVVRGSSVWATGSNDSGQLGQSLTTKAQSSLVQMPSITGVTAVAAGKSHSVMLKSDGTVWSVGGNSTGVLGDGTATTRTSPVSMTGITGVVALDATWNHTLMLKSDGTVWAVGENTNGQLGDGTTTNRSSPVQVQNVSNIVGIGAGDQHTLMLRNDGRIFAVGNNNNGQLGLGTTAITSLTIATRMVGIP